MSNLKDVNIAIRNINNFIKHNASKPAHIVLDKGNTKQGITHKVFIYNSDRSTSELFRDKTLLGLLNKLIGFDYGLRQFRLFRQR